jgi:glyoxylase-like metal-dependent hydrolase (beta-lactamase superfamily II)
MATALAILLAPGIWRVPTFPRDLINSFVLQDADGQVTLVDCGMRGAPKRVLAALDHIGVGPRDVTRILLTHGHPDHAGGLAKLRGRTGAKVAVHESDAPYVREGRTPIRDQATFGGRLLRRRGTWGPSEVTDELQDRQLLDIGGGLRVIHTPGHTPGHVSLLHEPTRTLITGDALFNWRRRIEFSPAWLCTDARLCRQTAHTLGELDYTLVAFTHGPEIRDGAREAVRGFLQRQEVDA